MSVGLVGSGIIIMSLGTTGAEKALDILRKLPRVALNNLKPLPERKPVVKRGRGQHGGQEHFHRKQGAKKHQHYNRIGYEGGACPFYLRIPREFYYKGHHLRRQYPPLSMKSLQTMIDTNQLNPDEPIDMTAICNTKLYWLKPTERHYGVNLTDEGIDCFKAKVNIEVQWATEPVIAAVERNGGTITTAFYDIASIFAAHNPEKYFLSGRPIPRRLLPPENCIGFYTDPQNRGYLADPDKIAEARVALAQKYGYVLPDLTKDEKCEMLTSKKDPRQVFFGLEPGWVVNLRDKVILKPKDEEFIKYYQS